MYLLQGGVSGEASMTAYVLIALYEGHWCDGMHRVSEAESAFSP